MKLPRSSFYYKEKIKQQTEVDLRRRIEKICIDFPGYGYHRVTHQLRREDHKRVLRIMRENDLLCRVKRRWVKTINSGHNLRVYPYRVKGLVINRIDQVWLTEFTYIRIKNGFVYLAAILDAFSRRVIGYNLSTGLDTSLVLEALFTIRIRESSMPQVIT